MDNIKTELKEAFSLEDLDISEKTTIKDVLNAYNSREDMTIKEAVNALGVNQSRLEEISTKYERLKELPFSLYEKNSDTNVYVNVDPLFAYSTSYMTVLVDGDKVSAVVAKAISLRRYSSPGSSEGSRMIVDEGAPYATRYGNYHQMVTTDPLSFGLSPKKTLTITQGSSKTITVSEYLYPNVRVKVFGIDFTIDIDSDIMDGFSDNWIKANASSVKVTSQADGTAIIKNVSAPSTVIGVTNTVTLLTLSDSLREYLSSFTLLELLGVA